MAAAFHPPTLRATNSDTARIKAQSVARAVERARRNGRPGLVMDHTTGLKVAFYDAIDHGRPWTGR